MVARSFIGLEKQMGAAGWGDGMTWLVTPLFFCTHQMLLMLRAVMAWCGQGRCIGGRCMVDVLASA